MTNHPKNHSVQKYKLTLIIVVVVMLLATAAYYYLSLRNGKSSDQPTQDGNTESFNLNPPTNDELRETEEFKKNLVNEAQGSANQVTATDGLKSVTPIIGYLQQAENLSIESNGYISGIAENDGICNLVLEKDNVKVTETRQAKLDAQGMICGQMVISRDRLSQGSWKGYISYKSTRSSGTSEQRSIEVK